MTIEQKSRAMQAIADLKGGNKDNGKIVFRRNCIACHQVFGEGATYGPAMDKVATRLTRFKMLESIFEPNAEVDKKYLSTLVALRDGKTVTGLVVSESKAEVVIFDGKEKRTIPRPQIEEQATLKQSSMPEGLAATMSPVELLDVIEFLSSLK